MTTYVLGSSSPEIARLDAQAEFLREPTRILLASAGLGPGMRVLDLGTGLGHVAAAVAELVGPQGRVVGLDNDPRMLAEAEARTAHLPQVRFVQGDVTTWTAGDELGHDGGFDAVVGRLILFHLSDPVAVLRHHLGAVRPGGRVVLLDYDIGGLRAEPMDPVTERMGAVVLAAFRAAGADPTIGSRLQPILRSAGVDGVGGFGLAQFLAPDSPVGPAMLAGVVRSLAPVIVRHGLATEAELGLDTLAERSAAALRDTGSVLVPPLLVGAWGQVPAAV